MVLNVVVLGAGAVGGGFAKSIKGKKNVSVTVVNPTNFVSYKIASARAAIYGTGTDVNKTLYPIQQLADKVIVAKATEIKSTENQVLLSNGTSVSYDILVCATGSTNASPGTLRVLSDDDNNNNVTSTDDARTYYKNTSKAFEGKKKNCYSWRWTSWMRSCG